MQTRINSILSDYDGTLSPTDTLRSNTDLIPEQLEEPCGKYHKEFQSALYRVKIIILYIGGQNLLGVLSCIMGIESIALRIHKNASNEIEGDSDNSDNLGCIKKRYLLPNSQEIL